MRHHQRNERVRSPHLVFTSSLCPIDPATRDNPPQASSDLRSRARRIANENTRGAPPIQARLVCESHATWANYMSSVKRTVIDLPECCISAQDCFSFLFFFSSCFFVPRLPDGPVASSLVTLRNVNRGEQHGRHRQPVNFLPSVEIRSGYVLCCLYK